MAPPSKLGGDRAPARGAPVPGKSMRRLSGGGHAGIL